jgi:hypothetical protein
MRTKITTVLVVLSLFGLLVTAVGHGFLGTKALLEGLHKANVNAEWVSAIKAIWILLSVNLVFFAVLIAGIFFRKNPISSNTLANSIAFLLLTESGYLFFELGVFPGAVLMLISGALLLVAARINS